jgi:hypothetical protein
MGGSLWLGIAPLLFGVTPAGEVGQSIQTGGPVALASTGTANPPVGGDVKLLAISQIGMTTNLK